MSSEQYSSLQGLRGVAIILVILFHLYPDTFKNGFVGVDIFFVLSGFLMSKILDMRLNFTSIRLFYEKRFKRILPLYYITIFLTIIGVLAFVVRPDRSEFIEDLKWAILLIFNYKPIIEHQNYWDQISTFRYLTHLWSLCVELQYYLIFPVIQFISFHLSFNFQIITHVITIAISCLFQYLMPFELSYSFLFARVWQFLLGSLTYKLSKKETEPSELEKAEKELLRKKAQEVKSSMIFSGIGRNRCTIFSIIFMISICLIMNFPDIFNESLTRIIISMFVVYICAHRETLENSFLGSKPLLFVGDVSFVLYLTHWPVIKIIEYIGMEEKGSLSLFHAFLAILITIICSLFLHYTLEKRFVQLDFQISFGTVAVCASISLYAIVWLRTDECWMQHILPKDVQNQIVWNFNSSNIFKPFEDFPCDTTKANIQRNTTIEEQKKVSYCRVMSNGVGKILVIGNSLALRAFPYLIEKFDGNYEELRLLSRPGSPPLLDLFPQYTKEFQEMIRWYQPDLLWIIQGINEINSSAFERMPKDRSLLSGIMQNVLDGMKEHAKIIYIDLPYYISSKNTVNNIAKSFIYGHDLEKTASHSLKEVDQQIGSQSLRLRSLICSKCYYNDVNKELLGNDTRLYDYEKNTFRPIVYDGGHLSWTAFQRLDNLYQNVVDHFNNYTLENYNN